MKKPTRSDAAAISAQAQATFENTPMSDVIQALASGQVTATALTKAYLARIEAYDRGGPKLNSIRTLNPDSLMIAGKLEDTKPSAKQPLAGVPLLVKDNIATGDKADDGGLAGAGGRAREERRHSGQTATGRRSDSPGQGEPDGIRQHARD
jgi:amidase